MLSPQLPGNIVPRTLAEEEAQCLDNRHPGEHYPHGSHRAGSQGADKVGIRKIVDAGDHHYNHTGNAKRTTSFSTGAVVMQLKFPA